MIETLLDATARVLTQDGYDRASTNRIAAAAGVSIGSLYQYFPNKEALVAALVERHAHEMLNMLRQAIAESAPHSLENSLRMMVRSMVDAHRVDPVLHRIFDEQVPRMGQLAEIEAVEREGFALVRGYLERHRDEIDVTDLDMATHICTTSVEALTHELIVRQPEPGNSEIARYVEEITRLILGYLRPHTHR
jgi:AcrR family transcriptional regulator